MNTCSFCGKHLKDFTIGLSGENALICNHCIADAVATLAKLNRDKRENEKPQLKLAKG